MVRGIFSVVSKLIERKTRTTCAVIVAAGASSRMNGTDKIFMPLGERELVSYSIEAFQQSELIDDIVIVCAAENIGRMQALCIRYGYSKIKCCVEGGGTRAESSYNGVKAAGRGYDIILIHDGARPFVTQEMIKNAVLSAEKYGASAPAVPVTSTIKRVKDGFVVDTPDRNGLYEIQTPQGFKSAIIKAALKNVSDKGLTITDDCMAAEIIGVKPHIFEGSRNNMKITVPEDVITANAIRKDRSEQK